MYFLVQSIIWHSFRVLSDRGSPPIAGAYFASDVSQSHLRAELTHMHVSMRFNLVMGSVWKCRELRVLFLLTTRISALNQPEWVTILGGRVFTPVVSYTDLVLSFMTVMLMAELRSVASHMSYGCHVRGEIQCVDRRRRQSRSFNWFMFHNVCWIGILHSPGMFTCSMFYEKQSKYAADPVCVGQREDFVWKCGFLEDVLCLFSQSRCPDMLWLCLEHLWIS